MEKKRISQDQWEYLFERKDETIFSNISDDKAFVENILFFEDFFYSDSFAISFENCEFEGKASFHACSFQSDVYFTISAIINHLRNSKDLSRCLAQTEYVRNIIEPGNFNRFNDGVIQASLLRASNKQELAYHLDYDLSKNMFDILITMIKHYDTQQGEALLEFIYAIAIQKLSLRTEHLSEICTQISKNINNQVFELFINYIDANILKNKAFIST